MKTKDRFSRFDLLRLRRQSTALLVANLFLGVFAAHAQTWTGSAGIGVWNSNPNWSTGVFPNSSTAVATFTTNPPTTISFRFWCKFQKRSAHGRRRPRRKGVTCLPNRA
jgi:hypothetical protein